MIKLLKDKFKLKAEKEISYNHINIDKEEESRILYYDFKENIVRMEHTDIHYLDHTFSNVKNSSYSFKNKSFINKSINNLIYKFSDSIFEEQLFYNLLERNMFQSNPQEIYLKIYNNLIKQIQEHIDIIVQSRLRYFTGGVSFYKEYNKFKTNDNLNYFLIENLFKELRLNEYYLTFQLKNSYDAILLEYFKQSVIYIRENEDVYNCSKIKSEINRLKSEILKNDFLFLQSHVNNLIDITEDLHYKTSNKKTNEKLNTCNLKKMSKKQKQLLYDFLKPWFKTTTNENIQNLIDLNLSSIKGNLKLIKNTKSLSLLLFKLIEKNHYTEDDIASIYECKKIIHTNNKKIDKQTLSKHFGEFNKGYSIDSNKQNQKIKTLMESL